MEWESDVVLLEGSSQLKGVGAVDARTRVDQVDKWLGIDLSTYKC